MVGFIKGLFGAKSNATEAPAVEPMDTAVKPAKSSQAYFLSPDDAKTFGDIDYMRTAKTVRRTFPKTVATGTESEKEYIVSAMGMEVKSPGTLADVKPTSQPVAETSAPKLPETDESVERRRTDSSMDMFRNMARDIKKR